MWWCIICGLKCQVEIIFNAIGKEDILLDMVKNQTDICRSNVIKHNKNISKIFRSKQL